MKNVKGEHLREFPMKMFCLSDKELVLLQTLLSLPLSSINLSDL